jgi:CRISPR-associated protein Csm2
MSFQNNPRGGGFRAGSQGGGRHPAGHSGSGRSQPHQDTRTDLQAALQSTVSLRYRDSDGHIRPALLDKEAQDAADALKQITTTQLRRFFEQVGAIKRRIDVDSSLPESEILAQMAFLKAASAYAAGRSETNKPVLDFTVKHANSIRTKQDFLDFHRHFEAVIAFHKVYGKDTKGN